MDDFELYIPGTPVAKARPRFLPSGMVYTPRRTRAYESLVATESRRVMALSEPFTGPISVDIRVVIPIPRSWTKRAKAEAHRLAPGRPDLDNYCKTLLDAMNGVVFLDDSQVALITALKHYGSEGGVRIRVKPLKMGSADREPSSLT